MIIIRTDPMTGEINHLHLDITEEQLRDWHNGMVAQKAFPHLTPDQREYIISGIPPGRWDDYIGGGTQEYDESYEDDIAF